MNIEPAADHGPQVARGDVQLCGGVERAQDAPVYHALSPSWPAPELWSTQIQCVSYLHYIPPRALALDPQHAIIVFTTLTDLLPSRPLFAPSLPSPPLAQPSCCSRSPQDLRPSLCRTVPPSMAPRWKSDAAGTRSPSLRNTGSSSPARTTSSSPRRRSSRASRGQPLS